MFAKYRICHKSPQRVEVESLCDNCAEIRRMCGWETQLIGVADTCARCGRERSDFLSSIPSRFTYGFVRHEHLVDGCYCRSCLKDSLPEYGVVIDFYGKAHVCEMCGDVDGIDYNPTAMAERALGAIMALRHMGAKAHIGGVVVDNHEATMIFVGVPGDLSIITIANLVGEMFWNGRVTDGFVDSNSPIGPSTMRTAHEMYVRLHSTAVDDTVAELASEIEAAMVVHAKTGNIITIPVDKVLAILVKNEEFYCC